jgi:hypothetical protein
MTTVRMIPVHEIVRSRYPRPPPEERDQIAMAVGKAIDGTLADLGYQLRLGRRPTQSGLDAQAGLLLEESLAENAVDLSVPEKTQMLLRIREVVRAYRRSELVGLGRPKTRVCLIDGKVGVYAQPDFWDGRRRVFELKSYRAVPPPPDVALQLRLFQLAFPGLEMVLVCLDRHVLPVETTSLVVPPPTPAETDEALRLAFDVGCQLGQEKVLEYVEGPFVQYTLSPVPPTGEKAPEPTGSAD